MLQALVTVEVEIDHGILLVLFKIYSVAFSLDRLSRPTVPAGLSRVVTLAVHQQGRERHRDVVIADRRRVAAQAPVQEGDEVAGLRGRRQSAAQEVTLGTTAARADVRQAEPVSTVVTFAGTVCDHGGCRANAGGSAGRQPVLAGQCEPAGAVCLVCLPGFGQMGEERAAAGQQTLSGSDAQAERAIVES